MPNIFEYDLYEKKKVNKVNVCICAIYLTDNMYMTKKYRQIQSTLKVSRFHINVKEM